LAPGRADDRILQPAPRSVPRRADVRPRHHQRAGRRADRRRHRLSRPLRARRLRLPGAAIPTMTEPLRIVYLLEDTELAGGIRVAVAHADALIERGHDVTLATKGGPLTWRSSRAKWIYVDEWTEVDLAPFEFVVGTFWKTLFATHELAADRAIHLCQGYEGSFTAYAHLKDQIDEA